MGALGKEDGKQQKWKGVNVPHCLGVIVGRPPPHQDTAGVIITCSIIWWHSPDVILLLDDLPVLEVSAVRARGARATSRGHPVAVWRGGEELGGVVCRWRPC